jgi:phenylalanyl-tRNA synthetase alpha chain|tara:strand:- start:221 stop:1207 length:987 start_codon:yes stop_codon:yes gene_type:complete
MIKEINNIKSKIENYSGSSSEEIEIFRIKYVSKKSIVNDLFLQFKNMDSNEKRAIGKSLNELKTIAKNKLIELSNKKDTNKNLSNDDIDLFLPPQNDTVGSLHPLRIIRNKIIKIFRDIGFTIENGPEIEDDWYNFTALNFPKNHPAREMQDTFFISKNPDKVLRTHTSNVQIRLMEKQKPPIRVVIPGRVYRNETVSAKSHCFFHQVEGLYVDKDVSFKNLKETLYYFAKEMFGKETKVRFRPSYFPFTEPSAEMDISWKNGWLEILGSGLVDPNVLKNCNIDPEKYSGFAFGMGIERIAMIKYGINDLRLFSENDKRFLNQFKGAN